MFGNCRERALCSDKILQLQSTFPTVAAAATTQYAHCSDKKFAIRTLKRQNFAASANFSSCSCCRKHAHCSNKTLQLQPTFPVVAAVANIHTTATKSCSSNAANFSSCSCCRKHTHCSDKTLQHVNFASCGCCRKSSHCSNKT